MVEVKEKKTDWKSIFRDFFDSSVVSSKKEDADINKWKEENKKIISASEVTIINLEKMLEYKNKKVSKASRSNNQTLRVEPVEMMSENKNMQRENDNRERE